MKKQILTLIIGILIGAIITTAVFLIIKGNTQGQGNKMNKGEMPSMSGSFSRPEGNSNRKAETESTDDSSNNIEE